MRYGVSVDQKAIVLHDYFDFPDGGGRTALLAARALEADLCYGFRSNDHPYWPSYAPKGQEYILGRPVQMNLLRQWIIQRRFMRVPVSLMQNRDVAVYSGSYAPLSILSAPARYNVCYCHTPPRFLYDQKEQFMASIPLLYHPVYKRALQQFQSRYERAMRKMDLVITNSLNVKQRIEKYLGLKSTIVYPPCEVEQYYWAPSQGYFLSTARHDPLKRVGMIIESFALLPDQRLVIISSGPESEDLKNRAEELPNVQFLGSVDENHYRKLLSECKATIYIPEEEDFGLSPVESMAAGKPVIGIAQGGLLESIIPGETGVLLSPPTLSVNSLASAIKDFDNTMIGDNNEKCIFRAKDFSYTHFERKLNIVKGKGQVTEDSAH